MAPTVSVILPVFNRLEYLRPALDSVFAQTFSDWELVIADDGSDQPTRTYLKTLEGQPRITVVWLAHTGNPGAVRNAALREATGEYIAFLDSDDLWLPRKLERQVAALRSRPDCCWSYTGSVAFDDTGQIKADYGPRPWTPYEGAIFEHLVTGDAAVPTPAVLVERGLLCQVGGFDEQQRQFEDYDLWMRFALRSAVVLVNEPLTRIRVHQQHYSARGIPALENRQRLLGNAQCLVRDSRLRLLIDRLRVQTTLNLANALADTNRLTALRTLLGGCVCWWPYLRWWTGALRVSLKLAIPRAVLAIYRRRRWQSV